MDVVLYMLVKKEGIQNNIENNNINNNINIDNDDNNLNREQINNNLSGINQTNARNIRRGFNIFLQHGLSDIELRSMRLLFHLSVHQQSLLRGIPLDWTEEGMLRREERWLINQLNNSNLNNNEQDRDNEREMINRNNNNYISLNVSDNDFENDIRRRTIESIINFEFEPSYYFLMGFCVGFIINIFSLLLLVCNFKPRFKIGLICGMLLSMLFFFMTVLTGR